MKVYVSFSYFEMSVHLYKPVIYFRTDKSLQLCYLLPQKVNCDQVNKNKTFNYFGCFSFFFSTMGLLTVLKKLKQKEKEMRILILYPYVCLLVSILIKILLAGSLHRSRLHFLKTFLDLDSGLDNAGKTTILKRFNGEEINTISPTLGFNIKTLEHQNYVLNIWDVGGQKSLRSYWRNYFESTDGLVWVVDSADRRRLEDCRTELHALLQEERLAGATLLVFCNKQDLPGSLTCEEIRDALGLDNIRSHHWNVLPCSAVTGLNLLEGVDWLVKDISARIFTLD